MDIRVCAAQMRTRELDLPGNTRRAVSLIQRAKGHEVHVICFSEGALTGWLVDAGLLAELSLLSLELADALRQIQNACLETGVAAVMGQVKPSGGRFYNEAIAIDSCGKIVHTHSKQVLTGYEIGTNYTPGCSCSPFPLFGVMFGVSICYEFEANDDKCRELISKGAQVVLNPKHHRSSPGTWPTGSRARVRKTTVDRAKTFGVPVVSVNRAVEAEREALYRSHPDKCQMSDSMIVDASGVILRWSYPLRECLLVDDLTV